MKTTLSMFVTAAMLAACGPSGGAAGGGAAAGDASLASFTGDWKVKAHIVGPWFTGPGFAPEPDAEILEKTLTISETSAFGAAALTCETATFAVAPQPLSGMFEGKVTDAYVARAALGIEGEQTPTLTGCTAGGAALSYHMIGKDTMLLAVGDIVYQLGRPEAEEPATPVPAAPAAPAPAEAPKPQ